MKKILFLKIFLMILVLLATGCASRKNNTARTRMYHAFFAKYNTYYNGSVAFEKGNTSQIKGHKDNYLEQLPLLITSSKATQGIGKGDYDKAIEKSQKTIKNHSIKKKPRRETGKKLTEKKKRFYAQKEFNPFLWKAWVLMADSYFKKGEFTEAASTYMYIARLYENDPRIAAEAKIGLAQCYTQMEWLYEAEELLTRIKRDTLPTALNSKMAMASANLLLQQKRNNEAIEQLEKGVKRKGTEAVERAREYYLLGQLHQNAGNKKEAFRYFSKAIAQSPPYELEVNARIRQTETLTSGNQKKIIRKLEKMIKSSKNESYLSQLHYALGNVYMAAKDTAEAVRTYETGVARSINPDYGTAMLHLSLANIYWAQNKFSKADANYQKAASVINNEENKDDKFKTEKQRLSVAGSVAPHSDIIEKNSELLHWSTLDDNALKPLIDKKIEEAKFEEKLQKIVEKKERKEARGSELSKAGTTASMSTSSLDEQDKWYFYNKTLIVQGIQNFTRTWGDRNLKDYWRLSNENIAAMLLENDTLATAGDSLATDSTLSESLTESLEAIVEDTLSTDPTTKEYWLQQIPKSDEKKAELHNELSNALFEAATIFEEKLGDKQLAMGHWERLINEYPEHERLMEAYYHMFICSSRWEEEEKAELYRNLLTTQYPDSSLTQRIQSPDFFESVEVKRHKEDSIYVEAYTQYTNGKYDAAISNCSYAMQQYPQGSHKLRFMFVDALSKLYSNRHDEALGALQDLIISYPKDSISVLAQRISTGIREGRLLNSGIATSIWERRLDGTIKSSSDSLPAFKEERNEPYYFILVFPKDSLDEKRLLFEMARYNFSRYMVRNFTMEFDRQAQITMLQVKEFLNFDEAFLYRKRLYGNAEMSQLLSGINSIVISKSNLDLLLQHYTLEDYRNFYENRMLAIPEVEIDGYTLDEPTYQN